MKLYYYKSKEGNYGDDLNMWLWKRLLPQAFSSDGEVLFCGIGTILNQDIPPVPRRRVVFSSGTGYRRPPEGFGDESWKIISVRGPLSAAILKLPAEAAVTDGAIFLASLPEFSPLPARERRGVAFMPHHENALSYGRWKEACRMAGITFIDPRSDSANATQIIRRSRLVIAEAMHAAIAADALRVHWMPVFASRNINHFKWLDWTLSLGLPYKPVALPPSTFWEAFQNFKLRFVLREQSGPFVSPGEALAHQHERSKQPLNEIWIRKKRLEKWDNLLGRIIKLPIIRSVIRAIDAVLIRKAASALGKIASESPPFLSEANVHSEKMEEMKNRLEIVRELAE